MNNDIVMYTNIIGYPLRRGKVRDVYDLGDKLIIVATDRISAFDWVLPTGIPNKGRMLTQMAKFWFEWLQVPHHMISNNVADMPSDFRGYDGRAMLVKKATVIPIECVARGYLAGSAWLEYCTTRHVCGVELPDGLCQAAALTEPIFTPATKSDHGHDENISFTTMAERIGSSLAMELKTRTLDIYTRAKEYAIQKNIIIADTKLEWGQLSNGELILVDEVLTPDSSRFWPKDSYWVGCNPPSFDKQFLRDWLESTGWDKHSPPPPIPGDIVQKTAEKYAEALHALTG